MISATKLTKEGRLGEATALLLRMCRGEPEPQAPTPPMARKAGRRTLIDKLKASGVEAELLTLEGAGHGFKGKDAETADKAMLAYFDKQLKK